MFLVSLDGGPSFLEQVLHLWLQDRYQRAIIVQFSYSETILSVVVPYDGSESCLLKPRAIRASSIVHGHSPGKNPP